MSSRTSTDPPRRSRLSRALAILLGVLVLLLLTSWLGFDRGPAGLWDELTNPQGEPPGHFDPESVLSLPEPARRFLLRSITPGALLARSVELSMEGTIVLDPQREPIPMRAEQVLAPPAGFVWSARTFGGMMRISGFDRYGRGEGEMRWKLFGLVPVMRADGSDVTRSAAGRLAMEAVLLPSSLVPGSGVRWEPVDQDRARFILTVGGETVSTTIEVDPDGRPLRAWAQRWNQGQYERFEVQLSGEVASGGYRIPELVEAGWRLGDPDEFRFFQARLTGVRFR